MSTDVRVHVCVLYKCVKEYRSVFGLREPVRTRPWTCVRPSPRRSLIDPVPADPEGVSSLGVRGWSGVRRQVWNRKYRKPGSRVRTQRPIVFRFTKLNGQGMNTGRKESPYRSRPLYSEGQGSDHPEFLNYRGPDGHGTDVGPFLDHRPTTRHVTTQHRWDVCGDTPGLGHPTP